jgi:replicative DNA helicase
MDQQPFDFTSAAHQVEAQILGAVFLDPTIAKDVFAEVELDSFTHSFNRNIYRMIKHLDSKGMPIDLENIVLMFEKDLPRVGGIPHLSAVTNAAFTLKDLDYKIRQLQEIHSRRKALAVLEEFREVFMAPPDGSFEENLDAFEQKTLEIRPKPKKENQSTDRIVSWYENLAEKRADPNKAFGIMTAWEQLNRMTLGFQRGDLIVIGARTSVGKSAFASEIERFVNSSGMKVGSFSLEMSAEQKYNRYVSSSCKISSQALRTGNLTDAHFGMISGALDKIRTIHIDDSRNITCEYITSEMRRLKRQQGLDLVLIDYLQEIVEPTEKGDNGGSAMQRVCQKFRKAAMDCDCAVIGLSQVKDEVDNRQNKRPTISDLYGGNGIKSVADLILLLYRDDYYDPDSPDKGLLEVNLAKQRNGPTGRFKLKYDRDYQLIT